MFFCLRIWPKVREDWAAREQARSKAWPIALIYHSCRSQIGKESDSIRERSSSIYERLLKARTGGIVVSTLSESWGLSLTCRDTRRKLYQVKLISQNVQWHDVREVKVFQKVLSPAVVNGAFGLLEAMEIRLQRPGHKGSSALWLDGRIRVRIQMLIAEDNGSKKIYVLMFSGQGYQGKLVREKEFPFAKAWVVRSTSFSGGNSDMWSGTSDQGSR